MTPADRLGLALLLAVTLHALVILGVTFDAEERARRSATRPLEIILVHSQGEQPEKADYLAQVDQRGGGNVRETIRPSSPQPNPRPVTERGTAPETRTAAAPSPAPERPRTVVTTRSRSETQASALPSDPSRELPLPDADTLREHSLEMARLSAEIHQSQQAYARMPRQEWVTANTRRHDSAAYEEAWRAKVERIGNLNYPDEARRQNLSGALILDVAIRADGSLDEVKIQRSSGSKVLDDGAVRIVRLAAPFSAFPPSIRERTDVLHIVRTWQFENDSRLQTY
ncbi:MAG: energy transducer TonB [Thiohalomonadaceae bacterium]